MNTFTFRIPDQWAGRLDSVQLRAWLAEYLRQPKELPPDPGPGDARISLSLPRRAVRVLAAMHDVPVSVALRRLVALHEAALVGTAVVPPPVQALPGSPARLPAPGLSLPAARPSPQTVPSALGNLRRLPPPEKAFREMWWYNPDLAISPIKQYERLHFQRYGRLPRWDRLRR